MPDREPSPPRIYGIADADTVGRDSLAEAVGLMAEAGVGWIQVRIKDGSDGARHRCLEACVRRLEGTRASLWVNDRPDLAKLLPVAGVHVGQNDLPPWAARRVVGEATWIGLSCHDLEQVAAADADPAVDVVALGPIFHTRSKRRPDPVVGLDGLRRARARTRKPLVAIGGIDAERLCSVLAAGADSVALIGALGQGGELAGRARHLVTIAEASP